MLRLFHFLGAAALLVLIGLAPAYLGARLGGGFTHAPEDAVFMLSPPARQLISRAFEGFEDGELADYNVHVLALGTAANDGYVHPHLREWWHPLARFRFGVLLSAAGVRHPGKADEEYVARLLRLGRGFPLSVTRYLNALDGYYTPDGRLNRFRTRAFVPNGYVARLASRYGDAFRIVVSINPYRQDALAALDRWARAGIRMVYWLPVAQGIDPADPRLAPFYAAMKRHDLTLLVHVGANSDIDTPGARDRGSPLRLLPALDAGLRVVMLTGGSLGTSPDPEAADGAEVANYRLFLRLMNEPRYRDQLYGDISALFYADRSHEVLSRFLQRRDLQSRLVYGSDYPFSAINVRIRLGHLERGGFISAGERRSLAEIYRYNPLLFNFVLARTVHLPHTDVHFDDTLFQRRPVLEGEADAAEKEKEVKADS